MPWKGEALPGSALDAPAPPPVAPPSEFHSASKDPIELYSGVTGRCAGVRDEGSHALSCSGVRDPSCIGVPGAPKAESCIGVRLPSCIGVRDP